LRLIESVSLTEENSWSRCTDLVSIECTAQTSAFINYIYNLYTDAVLIL